MATFEILALITEQAKKNIATMLATGKSYKVTHYTVGDQGHDLIDPYNAKTPDVHMVRPLDERVWPPIPITSTQQDSGVMNPRFICNLPAGQGTGVISSFYLYATVVYDPDFDVTLNSPPLTGVARFTDLPISVGNLVGDVRNVLEDGLDYYWDGAQWKQVSERFLFGIGNAPQLIKLNTQADTYNIGVQS